ncbi:MAG: DNA-binding beta-propeller fold protein YncE [Sulfurimonas sp.]|jgi:DNA-binding beta-propeller fold protein YncE
MKLILTILLLISSVYAVKIQEPNSKFIASGAVVDLMYKDKKLYAATSSGSVDIFDIDTHKLVQQIEVEKIKDFMGDKSNSKVYSVDKINDKILVLSQGQKGARRIHIYQNKKLKLIIPYTKKLFIAKAKFLDKNTIIMALLSNEIISYNIKKATQNYRIQVSQSKFSNFSLTENKKEIVVADESGIISILNAKNGLVKKRLSGQNLDNVFQVDIKNGIIATAGQDRRMVIYTLKSNAAYYEMSDFLIYSVGLSPSGKIVGYASDQNNNITVFNTQSKKVLGKFGGNKMTLSNILFLNESTFLCSSDDKTINMYTIK